MSLSFQIWGGISLQYRSPNTSPVAYCQTTTARRGLHQYLYFTWTWLRLCYKNCIPISLVSITSFVPDPSNQEEVNFWQVAVSQLTKAWEWNKNIQTYSFSFRLSSLWCNETWRLRNQIWCGRGYMTTNSVVIWTNMPSGSEEAAELHDMKSILLWRYCIIFSNFLPLSCFIIRWQNLIYFIIYNVKCNWC